MFDLKRFTVTSNAIVDIADIIAVIRKPAFRRTNRPLGTVTNIIGDCVIGRNSCFSSGVMFVDILGRRKITRRVEAISMHVRIA